MCQELSWSQWYSYEQYNADPTLSLVKEKSLQTMITAVLSAVLQAERKAMGTKGRLSKCQRGGKTEHALTSVSTRWRGLGDAWQKEGLKLINGQLETNREWPFMSCYHTRQKSHTSKKRYVHWNTKAAFTM